MYDVKQIIDKMSEQYENAIPVFGGVIWAYKYVCNEDIDLNQFISFFPSIIHNANFFNWHEGAVGALRRFCRICLVDPQLIETYLGISFEELVKV